MVRDFRHGTDGAAGRANLIALAKGDCGRNAFDSIDAGSIHSLKELSGVWAKGLCVTALAFGVEGVEGEGGLS
jgi:hypothetical protein